MSDELLKQIELAEERAAARGPVTAVVEKTGKQAEGLRQLESPDRLKKRAVAARAKEAGDVSSEYETFGTVGPLTGEDLVSLERVLGRNDLLDISWLALGARRARGRHVSPLARTTSSRLSPQQTSSRRTMWPLS
jgi:hypothetical protein